MASTSTSGPVMNTKVRSRIETWRQEVSDATSSKERQEKSSDRSPVRRASFLSRIIKAKGGKDHSRNNERTEMYGQDEDNNERKERTNKDDDESLLLKSESTEPDALKKRRERLERAAKLMTSGSARGKEENL